MIKGFQDFVLRGNVVDLAIAVVIGAAFTSVVTAFTTKVVDPLLASVGGPDTAGLGFFLRDQNPETFVDVGALISAVLNFLIVAAVVYFALVVPMNALLELRRRLDDAEGVAVPEVTAPAPDVALLQEIRDLLAARGGTTSQPGR